MTKMMLSRRVALFGALSLPGCTVLSTLNDAAQTLDTYDLSPASIARSGNASAQTLLVLEPTAAAAVATDRILVRPNLQSVTYLPDARWADTAPLLLQSLLVRSLSATRSGFVGAVGSGPVPDIVLLSRIDSFEVVVSADGVFEVSITFDATLLRDADQNVIASRTFSAVAIAGNDSAPAIVAAFQSVMDTILPAVANWVADRT